MILTGAKTAYREACRILNWGYDPNTDAEKALPNAVGAMVELFNETAREMTEMRQMKFAVEQTPKQWSTAQAPTMDAIANTFRGIQAETENERLRRRVRELRDCISNLLLSADVSWEEQRLGHDWAETCEGARAELAK
jgi:hypothetical protein